MKSVLIHTCTKHWSPSSTTSTFPRCRIAATTFQMVRCSFVVIPNMVIAEHVSWKVFASSTLSTNIETPFPMYAKSSGLSGKSILLVYRWLIIKTVSNKSKNWNISTISSTIGQINLYIIISQQERLETIWFEFSDRPRDFCFHDADFRKEGDSWMYLRSFNSFKSSRSLDWHNW